MEPGNEACSYYCARGYCKPDTPSASQCLGSEDVSDARGDVVAADCMKRLRQVNQELGRRGYLAQATITLQLKGLAVFDSRSKVGVVKWAWFSYRIISYHIEIQSQLG